MPTLTNVMKAARLYEFLMQDRVDKTFFKQRDWLIALNQ